MRACLAVAAVSLLAAGAQASEGPDAAKGMWKTIDERTGQVRGVVELFQQGDELEGRVVQAFPRPGRQPICYKCPGDLKNKPVIGMVFMWGLKRKTDGWGDGEVFDPESGNIYDVDVHVLDDGRKLEVRGYMGLSLLGRTQIWERP